MNKAMEKLGFRNNTLTRVTTTSSEQSKPNKRVKKLKVLGIQSLR
jgi:hypothetical protein